MNELITTSPVEIVTDRFCRQCGGVLAGEDRFCGECGSPRRETLEFTQPNQQLKVSLGSPHQPNQSVAVTSPSDSITSLLNNRFAVVGIIALIGPLGLPALWFSPRFSKTTKTVTTISYVVLTTVVPIVAAWYWLDYSLRPLVEAFAK